MDELPRPLERQEATGSEGTGSLRKDGATLLSPFQQPLEGKAGDGVDLPGLGTIIPISPVMLIRPTGIEISIAGMLLKVPDYLTPIIMKEYDDTCNGPLWTAHPRMRQDFQTWFVECLKDRFLGHPLGSGDR